MKLIDFYKSGHIKQYPENTTLVYSNFTPRKSRVEGVDHMVFFGLQYIIKEYLQHRMNEYFFNQPLESVLNDYQDTMDNALGPNVVTTEHIRALHELGYLPLHIKALPEGTRVPLGTPAFTMWNTLPEFYWVTNYFETLISNLIWKPCTSATTANQFRKAFDKYAELTGADPDFVDFQGHDFSFRGMSGIEDAASSGAAHLLSFKGTDTVPAIEFLERYYFGDETFVGGSVPATEHSVMCAGGEDGEFQTLKRLVCDIYPSGVVSVVSDTWDLFQLLTEYLPRLKDEILARDGKVVIRPDSGTPHKILNGDPDAMHEADRKGVFRLLDEVFGHTLTEKNYRVLDSHVGAIYGDGINIEEQHRILQGMMDNGYASSNIVMGLGSFAYQYVTRDTYGTVCKATYVEVDGEGRAIFKSPKTGGWKKSHKGLLRVNSDLTVTEDVSWPEEGGVLNTVFLNGKRMSAETLVNIRARLKRS